MRSPTFANSTYLSERASADRNFCLGYMMREEGAFPEGVDIMKTLESYFMYCSIECTVHTLSVVAGTFANGGTCPVTGKKVFDADVVRNCLSVMHSCGMYDYSGTFAYKMGFPCKSGVGGALMIVIPGVCGFCTWSPRLDDIGNSVRGVYFCKLIAKHFSFHAFAPLLDEKKEKDEDDNVVSRPHTFSPPPTNLNKKDMESKEGVERRGWISDEDKEDLVERWDPRRHIERDTHTEDEDVLEMLWSGKFNKDFFALLSCFTQRCFFSPFDINPNTVVPSLIHYLPFSEYILLFFSSFFILLCMCIN